MRSKPFFAVSITLVLVIGGFVYLYIQDATTISARDLKINDAQGKLVTANNQISNLNSQLTAAISQRKALQDSLSLATTQITSLQIQMAAAKSQADSLQGQLTTANNRIASLGNNISTQQAQIATYEKIIHLNQSSVKASALTVNQNAKQLSSVTSFYGDFAGFVVITGTSTTSNGYLIVTDSFQGYPYNQMRYAFGNSGNIMLPVLPGNITVYFGNENAVNGATATLTVTYFY